MCLLAIVDLQELDAINATARTIVQEVYEVVCAGGGGHGGRMVVHGGKVVARCP